MVKGVSNQPTLGIQASWQELYQAALFENDRDQIARRIADAERAILDRVNALSRLEVDHIDEDQLLEDALYALRALHSSASPETRAAA